MCKNFSFINKKSTPHKVVLFSSILALAFISTSSLFISLFFVNKKNEFLITGITFLLLFSIALAASAYNIPFKNEQKEKNNTIISSYSSYLITTALFTSSTALLSLFFIIKPINFTLVAVDISLILLASLSLATTIYLFRKQEKSLLNAPSEEYNNPSAPNFDQLGSQLPHSTLQQNNNDTQPFNIYSPPPYQQFNPC